MTDEPEMDRDAAEAGSPAPDPGTTEAVRCADCARSDSLVTDLDPVDRMPIPVEAVAGFPDGVPRARGLDRRAFLRTGVLGLASVYAASKIDWTRAYEAAVAEGASPANQVVMIYLNGGNDGLNTIVPIADYAAYTAARPNLARAQGPSVAGPGGRVGSTVMPGTGGAHAWANVGVSGVGNNNDTKGFDTLWGDGSGGATSDLAVWPAADYTPANRSHFDSRDYWFAGALQKMTTGWLGRWLDLYGSTDNPLQAVSIDSTISKQIRSARAPVSAVRSLNGVEFRVDNVATTLVNTTEQMAPVAAVPVGKGNDGLARSRETYGRTVQVSRSLRSLAGAPVAAGYPQSDLSTRLQLAAILLSANLGVKVITLDWGSLDTHGNQLASQDPQLTTLSRALAAFKDDLTARGIEGRVMTVVFSEFGRRVASNNTGTDHGAGGLMMAMGSSVVGGMRGRLPGAPDPVPGRPAGDDRLPGRVQLGRLRVARRRPGRGDPGRALPPRGAAGRVRPPARIAGVLIAVSLLAAATAVAAPRVHRLTLPPPPPLPTSLAVDEDEWTVIPSKRVVAAGPVTLRVYNRGMDDHDLSLVDATGALHRIYLAPGTSSEIQATLTPGTWKIWCSLFAGTPDSHELFGMVSTIEARIDPAHNYRPARRALAKRGLARH